jgi:hypothetical protein
MVKKLCRCGRNSLKMNKLGKDLTCHSQPEEFYPEIFWIAGV